MILEHDSMWAIATKGRWINLAVAVLGALSFGSHSYAVEDKDNAASGSSPVSAKIADLAWLQGHWTTKFGANELHEIWSPPSANCMMASFCWIKEGRVWMYELLTIAEVDSHIVLRFKHFSHEMRFSSELVTGETSR